MEKLFDNFYNYKGFGPGVNSVKANKETCDYFKGRLPDQLIEYWQEYGFRGWAEGLFWTVNPLDYTGVLKAWLEGTSFEDKDEYYVITRTAFGELEIWGKETGNSLMIVPQYGQIYPDEKEIEKLKNGVEINQLDCFSHHKIKAIVTLPTNPISHCLIGQKISWAL